MCSARFFFMALAFALISSAAVADETMPIASVNDNRAPAGVLRNSVLTLHLEVRPAVWYPEKDGGPHLTVSAFSEEGHAAQIPGPMIRVPEGTEISATVRNLLDHTVYIHGLGPRSVSAPPAPADPTTATDPASTLEIAPGAVREVHFKSGSAGSYYYWGSNDRQSLLMRSGTDSMLAAAFVVDPPGARQDDRVFVLNTWLPTGGTGFNTLPTINGKSWPYTEHLDLRVGDTVNWRWINTSDADHAMHMHGFYFQVNGIGDQDHFAAYKPAERPTVVTQEMPPGATFDMAWTPERPGHWIMHCHFTIHMMIGDLPNYPVSDNYTPENAGMAGLILGVNVLPAAKPSSASSVTSAQVHRYRLLVRDRPATTRTFAGYSFDLIKPPGHQRPSNELQPVGDPLVLIRGEPAEIEVVNQLKEPTTVHWHGIELESPYDGVPGWSGDATHSVPPIPPGGTFVARMTPPRAGTFIYHSHWHERKQLGAGLTGPLIVLPPGEKFDPASDKTFLFTRDGTDGTEPLLLNGIPQPAPIPLTIGTRYRFRFINITPVDSDLTYSIVDASGTPAQWRAIAKDGWDLSTDQTSPKPAHEDYLSVGETRDYFFTPDKPGELYLRAVAFQRMWISATLVVSSPQK